MSKRVVPIICLVDPDLLDRLEPLIEQFRAEHPLSNEECRFFEKHGWTEEMLLYGFLLETAIRPIVGLPATP